MKICSICNNIYNEKKFIKCDECQNYQCLECFFSFNKCCFCSFKINIYKYLFYNFSNELYENISEKLHQIFVEFSEKNYFRIFIINYLFEIWASSNYLTLEENASINSYFTSVFVNSFIPGNENILKNSIKFLLNTFNKYIKNNNFIINNLEKDDKNVNLKYLKFKMIKTENILKPIIYQRLDNSIYETPYEFKDITDDKILTMLLISFFSFFSKWYNIVISEEEINRCTCNDLTCSTCNNIYCKFCLEILDSKHSCEGTVVIENVKMCPNCKVLIEKKYGCDDMWCSICKNFFSWNRGIIRYDVPHNEDYIDYMSNSTKQKELAIQEVLNFNGGESNIIHTMVTLLSKVRYLDCSDTHFVKYILIPNHLKQVATLEILYSDDVLNRNFEIIKNIICICNLYMDIYNNIFKEILYLNKIHMQKSQYNTFSIFFNEREIIYKTNR